MIETPRITIWMKSTKHRPGSSEEAQFGAFKVDEDKGCMANADPLLKSVVDVAATLEREHKCLNRNQMKPLKVSGLGGTGSLALWGSGGKPADGMAASKHNSML